MDRDLVEVFREPLFRLLRALLRPAVSTLSGRRLAPPPLCGDVTMECIGGVVRVTVTQVVSNPYDELLSFCVGLPLPDGAVVHGLELVDAGGHRDSIVCERREAQRRAEAARAAGRCAALVAADRSAAVRQMVTGIVRGRPARLTLRFAYHLSGAVSGVRVTCSFDAGLRRRLFDPQPRPPWRSLFRFGTPWALSSMMGPHRGEEMERGVPADVLRPTSAAADVRVASERPGGAGAMLRGDFAGRPVRMVIDVRRLGSVGTAHRQLVSGAERITALIRGHQEPQSSDTERERIAADITALAMQHRIVTPWTSLIALDVGGAGEAGLPALQDAAQRRAAH